MTVWPTSRARVREEALDVVCITRCSLCPDGPEAFAVEARVEEGTRLLRAHQRKEHGFEPPEPRRRVRRRPDTNP